VRLNLLTLLAYLDDTLEPTQVRLVGQQVADSIAARDLLDRIQMLLRDRRTGLPAAGERIDANTLAAYLDGSLDPRRAAEVEESILASDAALAEAAACHQVLTTFKVRPEPVPLAPRQRMYSLVRGREGVPQRRDADEEEAGTGRRRSAGSSLPPHLRDPEPTTGLRVRKRRGGIPRWLIPAAAVLLVLIVGAVVATQTGVFRKPDSQMAKLPDETGRDTTVGKPTEPVRETPPTTTKETDPPKKIEPPVEPVVKQPDPPKVVEPLRPPEDPKPDIGEVRVSKPNPEQREFAVYAGAVPGLPTALLQKTGERETWKRVAKDGRVVTATPLLSLPGCASDLRIDSGVVLSLRGSLIDLSPDFPVLQSAVMLHVPETGVDLDCTVQTGRLVVANAKPVGEAHVRLRFLKQVWDLTLRDGQSAAALELASVYLPGTPFYHDRNGEGPTSFVNLYALRGQVDLKIRYQVFSLPIPSLYEWNDMGAATRGALPLQQPPRWFTDPSFPKTPRGQDLQTALEDLSAQMGKKPVEVVLLEARGQLKRREMAILCAGAIDDLGGLADALADEKDDAGREAAVFALRSWCSREADHDAKMYLFLCDRKGYTKTQAEMVMELLHLFSRDALDKPDTYEKLIANLRHEKLAIRYLSYWHLIRLVPAGRDIKYNPAGDTEARERGHDKWKKLIPDGALPPKAGPPKA
jgi:hypothetical protein